MLREILSFVRRLWSAVLMPYVLVALANLVADGVEAVSHIGQTLRVMLSFMCGRSHRAYPIQKIQLEALKRSALQDCRAAGGVSHSGDTDDSHHTTTVRPAGEDSQTGAGTVSPSSTSPSHSAADDGGDSTSSARRRRTAGPSNATTYVSLGAEKAPADPLNASETAPATGSPSLVWRGLVTMWDVVIERRLLRGKKGEVQDWLPPAVGHLLIPPSFPLCYDDGLHLLVGSFIGPIQQPTVSTLPSRHLEPQWPPHYGARHQPGATHPSLARPDASTDDNSSATELRYRSSDSGSSGFAGGTRAAGGRLAGLRAQTTTTTTTIARPKFRQVYRRESAKNIDLQPRHASSHLIASITSNHVLSYQGTRQKVLVIDLDETLCHVSTSTADMLGPPTFSEVIPTLAGSELFHVWERPYVQLFLSTAAQLYNLVLFTSASQPYADTILRRLDPHNHIKERYYRQDCRLITRGALARFLTAEKQKRQAQDHNATAASEADRTTDGEPWRSSGASADSAAGDPASRTLHGSAASRGRSSTAVRGTHTTTTAVRSFMEDRLRRRLVARGDDGSSPDTESSATTAAAVAAERTPDRPTDPLSRDKDDDDAVGADGGHGTPLGTRPRSVVAPKPALNENAKVLVKDLRVLKVPPELCVMIDNSEECTLLNRENALIIQPYFPSAEAQRQARMANDEGFPAIDPDEDEVLLGTLSLLECLLVAPDVRSVLRHGKIF